MKIEDIKNKIIELYDEYSQYGNIIGIGYGFKVINEIRTDELCISFFVLEKKLNFELNTNEIIPSSININGETINTDVIVRKTPIGIMADCIFNPSGEIANSYDNRQYNRPLKGGIQIDFTTPNINIPYITGTLGCLAIDNDTNSIVGLTNSHVAVRNFSGNEQRPIGEYEDYLDQVINQDEQPHIHGSNSPIGILKKYTQLKQWPFKNKVDCAVFSIKDQSIVDQYASRTQVGLSFEYLTFATTEEINTYVIPGARLYSAGRTTGPKGEGDVHLIVNYTNSAIGSTYRQLMNNQFVTGRTIAAQFIDVISFSAYNPPYTQTDKCERSTVAGDSGSCIIADINGVKKIVGMLNASTNNTDHYFCRIDNMCNELNISAYTGQTFNISNPSNKTFQYLDGKVNPNYIDVGGKRYWKWGIRNKV